ncbi:MAG: HAMP domain-containing sensor histidine kinase, partial [Kiritimatiellaeota bacterium]|nr:HAMP domain-containing sensor histidine kinase [Kiritimatiellota bacterium]
MNLRFPLSVKILLWFFLNLLLLGAAIYVFFRVQFHMGLDTLLTGQAGERIEALSNIIFDELRAASAEERTEVLQYFGSSYGVQILLVRPDGGTVAGDTLSLPPEVREQLGRFGPPRMRPPQMLPRADDAPLQPLPPLPEGTRAPHPKFMVRSTAPAGYWVGIRLPPFDRGHPELQQVLLLFSPTLSGGGLFIDFKPWLLVGFGAVLFSVLFWLPLIRGITRSIKQLTAATGQIAEGHFDVRVDERRRDELGRLGAEINSMAARLDGLVVGQKRFLGDVAHELCSPLARMQVALGILEQRAETAQQAYVNDVREEVQEMSNLVNELLLFSKASLREKAVQLQRVPLAELARRVAAREAGAGDKVQVQMADDLTALAEPDLLARALANLVRNALRYAGDAGPVFISAEPLEQDVVVRVSDAGPGVPEDALQKIFDPFYRLEASRNRDTGGIGLGLAIVKTCVEACQGTVTATNRAPSGLQIEIDRK